METISSIFKVAAEASAAGYPTNRYLAKLQNLLEDNNFFRALEKSLSYGPSISTHIAASGNPMATALEVNHMDEERRNELRMQVDVGL